MASDLRPWRCTSLPLASLLGSDLKVINFVDYSLNQRAPAGHESVETPIGNESWVHIWDFKVGLVEIGGHNQSWLENGWAAGPTEDAHARMDRLEQRMRQLRLLDGGMLWDDFDGLLVASLPAKFRMPKIERYMGIRCPRIHWRLYSTVMRAHGLDEAQMIMLFPMSLSGAAQCWFASLDVSHRRTWDELTQEFL
ncbi:hypothetical protein CK203_059262 [Vitis vinifera]|uniref:Retrotransposon gag domain-containing protein n=1 Tax=Vitis vinifera TaxID=29760 RepID=A0A438GEC0_VITVI|nr:hypothetical protein CK203_059262 [Vitis vinifera]